MQCLEAGCGPFRVIFFVPPAWDACPNHYTAARGVCILEIRNMLSTIMFTRCSRHADENPCKPERPKMGQKSEGAPDTTAVRASPQNGFSLQENDRTRTLFHSCCPCNRRWTQPTRRAAAKPDTLKFPPHTCTTRWTARRCSRVLLTCVERNGGGVT